jgi:hypothetical protein
MELTPFLHSMQVLVRSEAQTNAYVIAVNNVASSSGVKTKRLLLTCAHMKHLTSSGWNVHFTKYCVFILMFI